MKKLALVFAAFALISCKNEAELQKNVYPKPIKVYQKDGISVNLYDFNSFKFFLESHNDTTYVVNFWATWCKPCVAELPNFEKINAVYKDQKVKVILVSLDMKKQVESHLLSFMKRKNLQSAVVLLNDPNANAWISKVDATWSGAIPATVIYNKNKRKFYEQSFTYEALEKEIEQFNNNSL